jgi:hypothetical protein
VKDLELESGVQRLLDACASGDPAEVGPFLHRDFVAVGVEEGMYLNGDRATYLSFLARDVRGRRPAPARIDWIDIRHRVAAGCLVREEAEARRTLLLTMLWCEEGWRIMTATLGVEPAPFATAERQVRLQ